MCLLLQSFADPQYIYTLTLPVESTHGDVLDIFLHDIYAKK